LKIDVKELRRHYESLSDEELLTIDPEDLTEAAREVYEQEVANRRLHDEPVDSAEEVELPAPRELSETLDHQDDADFDFETDPEPDWAEDAAVACSFSAGRDGAHAPEAARARGVLRAAKLPCYLIMKPDETSDPEAPTYYYCLMVPSALALTATSILDRDLFNEQHESDWRTHLEALSDKELRAVDPDLICVGMLDRVARLKRAYADELTRRGINR